MGIECKLGDTRLKRDQRNTEILGQSFSDLGSVACRPSPCFGSVPPVTWSNTEIGVVMCCFGSVACRPSLGSVACRPSPRFDVPWSNDDRDMGVAIC